MKYEDKKTSYKRIVENKPVAPTVLFTPEAIAAMHHIVSKCGEEVGWFGTVEHEGNVYRIDNIMVPGQEVNTGTCELTNDGLTKLCEEIMDAGEDPTKIKFWGHSHHNMGVGPSGQDDNQIKDLLDASDDFFIRAICNKKGFMSVSLYSKIDNIVFDHVHWSIDFNIDTKGIVDKYDKLIEDNVKEFSYNNQFPIQYENEPSIKHLSKFKPSKFGVKAWK